ncbi:MAG: hypothetical protein NTX79_04485 [Candidatus Micrarchaeota archaeon]|nr:hypothetical protein [Candidatus Micrarchaeota archaeon]
MKKKINVMKKISEKKKRIRTVAMIIVGAFLANLMDQMLNKGVEGAIALVLCGIVVELILVFWG